MLKSQVLYVPGFEFPFGVGCWFVGLLLLLGCWAVGLLGGLFRLLERTSRERALPTRMQCAKGGGSTGCRTRHGMRSMFPAKCVFGRRDPNYYSQVRWFLMQSAHTFVQVLWQ